MECSKDMVREWRKDEFLISTDRSLISLDVIQNAYASDDMYWAIPLEREVMDKLINNSLAFGLYETSTGPEHKMVGFGRMVTDYVTFIWVADVFVLPAYRRRGLGTWLVECLDEVTDMIPTLRRAVLTTTDQERLYQQKMRMIRVDSSTGHGIWLTKQGPGISPSMRVAE